MSNMTMTKVKWFWAWDDDKEEEWLHQMALQGWHLSSTGFPTIYKFQKGKPANVYYRLDFKSSTIKDMETYFKLFADAGWEYCGMQGGWQYFRKEVKESEESEIFTDNESKIQKYQRVQMYLLILMMPLIMTLNNDHSLYIKIFNLCVFILMIIGQVKLAFKIRSMKNA